MAVSGLSFNSDNEEGASRDRAEGWIARFAPLVMEDAALSEGDVRSRLELLDTLRQQAPTVKQDIDSLQGVEHIELAQTFRQAEAQLGSLESDLRRRLARLAPGDPEGLVDLDVLRDRLSQRSARQEMGLPTDQEIPAVLEMKTGPGNLAAAGFLGVFSLGWNAFTAFHATMMIGGMAKAFGPLAFALLGFYAIFFLVGFGMLYAALNAASSESIELRGHELTVLKKLGSWTRKKVYALDPKMRATIGEVESTTIRSSNSNSSRPVPSVVVVDVEGRSIGIAQAAAPAMRDQVRDRINSYLDAQAEEAP